MRRMSPSTQWKETIPADEPARLEALAHKLRELQRKHAEDGRPLRALHAKGNAGVEASFTVSSGLPEHARVGLFAQPGTFKAYVRFSNGSGRRQRDAKGDVRGIAVKLLGVPGKKLIPGMESATTQDFLLIRTPSTPFRDADEFVWLVGAADRPALLLPRAIGRFGVARAFRLLKQLASGLSAPMASVATTRYFSALPIRFGAYAARYALEPKSAADPHAQIGRSPDHLRDELATRLARGAVEYDFRVQFFVDEERTPIEDASRDWSEADSPYLTVGRLTLPAQELDSERGRKLAAFVEGLSFDPWHALEELRPLGNMMRARNHAYRLSTELRGAAREPDGSESFD
jgi:hypothetical protein